MANSMDVELLWIWSDDLLTVITVVYGIVVVVGGFLSYIWFKEKKEEIINDREKNYKLLADGIKNNSIVNSYSLDVIYKRIKVNDFEVFARDFLHYSLEKEGTDEYRKIEEFIIKVGEEKYQNDPFEGCSPSDKHYLLSIKEVVSKEDNEAAKFALRELSRSIKDKEKQLHVRNIVTIVTIILTIVG